MTRPKKEVFKRIRLEFIDRPDDVHRMDIADKELNELAQSIGEIGLRQPIEVTPRGERYLIVFGDRRYLAHHILKKTDILCRVEEMDDEQVVIERATENLQRVNLTAFEEGHIYIGLMEKAGKNVAEIAKRFGKSQPTIQRYIDIMRMPDSFQQAIHKGEISMAVAEELWSCPDAQKREYFCELAVEHGITKMIARQWVTDFKKELRGRAQADERGGFAPMEFEETRIYRACDVCKGPIEYKDAINLIICPGCKEAIMRAQKE